MSAPEAAAAQPAPAMEPVGKAALIASVGGARGYADWANPDHRLRRLLAEFIGMAGLTFILSGGAAIGSDGLCGSCGSCESLASKGNEEAQIGDFGRDPGPDERHLRTKCAVSATSPRLALYPPDNPRL